MLAAFLAVLISAPIRAADAPQTFPETYVQMVRRSLAQDPFYGSRLVVEVQGQVAALSQLKNPASARTHLEAAAIGEGGASLLKSQLTKATIAATPAAALLVGNALARPEQFSRIVDGLESAKPGLGARVAESLSKAQGPGDRRILAALQAAGARRPQPELSLYTRDGRLEVLFDNASPGLLVGADAPPVPAQAFTPYSRPSGLAPSQPARPAPKPTPVPLSPAPTPSPAKPSPPSS